MWFPVIHKKGSIMHLLLAELHPRAGCEAEVERVLQGLVEATRTEPGTLHYVLHTPRAAGQPFVVYELYEDEAACQRHLDSPALKDAFARFETLLATPPRLVFNHAVDVTAKADLPAG
jgi:quinol monooxygenase YgiN